MSKTAEILAIGTELLLGNIANTDAQFISQELSALGINVFTHTVVGDNPERVTAAAKLARNRADIVITTGGLGPTTDDLTKENIAKAFGRELYFDEPSAARIRAWFELKRPGCKMSENNLRQAMMPEGCIILENGSGTAPGCIIEDGEKTAIMLPGPPRECRDMWYSGVKPYLQKISDSTIVSRNIRIFGIGESSVETRLGDIISASTNPTVAPYAKEAEVMLRVTARASSPQEGYTACDDMVRQIKVILGDNVYAVDRDSLEETILSLLVDKNLTIAAAESCTGGLFAKRLTDIPGSSTAFCGGVVAYSNAAKINILGVPEKTIREHGAVSEETALEMAKGARKIFGADIGVSVTGVAGPDSQEGKEVGTIYGALAWEGGCACKKIETFYRHREGIRYASVSTLFDMVRRQLTNLPL